MRPSLPLKSCARLEAQEPDARSATQHPYPQAAEAIAVGESDRLLLTWLRAAAKSAGFQGAMFPWQSGSDGQEETQDLNLNPHSLRWVPDNSYLQRHVGSAIAWNAWQYFQVTHDLEFLQFVRAELILDIAASGRAWRASTTCWFEMPARSACRIDLRSSDTPDFKSFPLFSLTTLSADVKDVFGILFCAD
jgi:hypothetical protein